MPWTNQLLRTLILPNDAGIGDARLVIGPDIPAILVSTLDAVAGIIFYSGFQNDDDDYYFIVSGSPGDSLNQMYYGYVRANTEVHVTKHEFATLIPGAPPDITEMELSADILDLQATQLIVRAGLELNTNNDIAVTVDDVQNALQTTASAVFVLLAVTCGVAFIAPPSGQVSIDYSAFQVHSAAAGFSITSPEVREGTTVGAGTVVFAANDDECLQVTGTLSIRAGAMLRLSGLTPGADYNVSLWTRTSGATASIRRRRVTITPTP